MSITPRAGCFKRAKCNINFTFTGCLYSLKELKQMNIVQVTSAYKTVFSPRHLNYYIYGNKNRTKISDGRQKEEKF